MFLQSFNSYCQSLGQSRSFKIVFLEWGEMGGESNKPKDSKVGFQIDFPALFFISATKIYYANWDISKQTLL